MSQLRVSDLFHLPPLRNAKLVCGQEGMDHYITGVNIIEAPDVADWVQEGDVLLTNLYSIDSLRPLDVFINKVSQHKLSALIVKTGLFVQEVPEELIEAARKRQLPVIEISKNVLYRDITSAITRQLTASRIDVLERFKEINDYFVSISRENQGFYRIVNSLEAFIGNPVVLYDKNIETIFSVSPRFSTVKIIDHGYEETPYYKRKILYPDHSSEIFKQFIFPITVSDDVKLYLAIGEVHKEIEEVHFIAIESAINALALDFLKQRAVIEVEKQFRSDLIGDLLSGRSLSVDETHRRANLLQWDLRKKHAVIVFHLLTADAGVHIADAQAKYDRLYELVRLFTVSTPFQVEDDRLILLWDGVSAQNRMWEERLTQKCNELSRSWSEIDKASVLRIGVGETADSTVDLARSYREALDALDISEALNFEGSAIFFSHLGIFRLLYQVCDRSRLHEYVPASLHKLLSSRPTTRNELMRTLDAFLRHNQNLNETARALGVHHKTVVYRIEKISQIAEIDFKNAEDVLMMQVGLKILTMGGQFSGKGQQGQIIEADAEVH